MLKYLEDEHNREKSIKNSSKVTCLIYKGGETKFCNYEDELAIEVNQWIEDREEIKVQVSALLYVLGESEVPEYLQETLGETVMALNKIIK